MSWLKKKITQQASVYMNVYKKGEINKSPSRWRVEMQKKNDLP